MDARAIGDLRALEERDRDLSGRADELRARDSEAAAIRARAERIEAFFAAYPVEETRRRETIRAAEAELDRHRSELADAERTMADARSEEEREHAAKAVARARDHIAVAESARLRATSAHDELEQEASVLPAELAELERRSGVHGARAIVEWAARTHANVFVELGQIDTQRDRVIREANELASMLLGEPTYGSTVAQALARVEAIS